MRKKDKSVQGDFGLDQMFGPNGKWCKLMKISFTFLTFPCRISYSVRIGKKFIVLNEFYSKKY